MLYRINLNKKYRIAPAVVGVIVAGVVAGSLIVATYITLIVVLILNATGAFNPDITIPVIYPDEGSLLS